jgi:hypothetical protein
MTDIDLAALVKQQLAGGASVQQSLGKLAETDPQLAPIARLLAQREEELRQELEQEEQDELLDRREEEALADRRRRAKDLREHLEGLTAEVAALRARFADVAGALGACRVCFGDDRACPWCLGRGGPGFMPPDPDGFERMVLPALRLHVRLRARLTSKVEDTSTRERTAS